MPIQYKGATPIEKNIIVVDEQGNEYEATYPKRAKGLVKNGRARFVDENKICLACPPNENLEDNLMTNTEDCRNNAEVNEQSMIENASCEKYSLAYALDMIERIATETEHIYRALDTIAALPNEATPTGGSAEAPAKAAADIVRCRETTSQKLLDFYGQMVKELKPSNESAKDEAKLRGDFLAFVRDTTVCADSGATLPDFEKIWHTVYHGK